MSQWKRHHTRLHWKYLGSCKIQFVLPWLELSHVAQFSGHARQAEVPEGGAERHAWAVQATNGQPWSFRSPDLSLPFVSFARQKFKFSMFPSLIFATLNDSLSLRRFLIRNYPWAILTVMIFLSLVGQGQEQGKEGQQRTRSQFSTQPVTKSYLGEQMMLLSHLQKESYGKPTSPIKFPHVQTCHHCHPPTPMNL